MSTAAWRKYFREWVMARKNEWVAENGPCVKCGSEDRLEVDHIDPSTKVTSRMWTWKESRRLIELAKCQVLCHECHRVKTKAEKQALYPPRVHGSLSMYIHEKCRCEVCKKFIGVYMRKYAKSNN